MKINERLYSYKEVREAIVNAYRKFGYDNDYGSHVIAKTCLISSVRKTLKDTPHN